MTDEMYTIDTTPFRVKIDEPAPGPSGDRLRKYNALKLNIDRQKTIGDIEYDDSILVEYLSPGSNEKVWAVCIQCGKGRWIKYEGYRHLCGSCSKLGKHPSEETCKKISDAMSGENNPMFGKHHSEETIKKISDNHPDFSGKNHYNFGKHPSEETRIKMSESHIGLQAGENHPMFGKHHTVESRIKQSCTQREISPEKFTGFVNEEHVIFRKSTYYAEWRTAVFERDNYTCQECGASGVKLQAHHITPFHIHPEPEYSLNVDNGITLCKMCHDKVNGREDEFYNKYTAIVKAKCGFKDDFLSSSVILEGLKKQNEPTQSLLNDEFVIPEKSEHQNKISNMVKSIVKQCVTYPPKPHSTRQPTIFDY